MIQHLNINISGKVQGVGFRYSARSVARALGIKGFVKNLYNGDVAIEAEGTKVQLDEFVSWCHKGSEYARVTNIIVSNSQTIGFEEFHIV